MSETIVTCNIPLNKVKSYVEEASKQGGSIARQTLLDVLRDCALYGSPYIILKFSFDDKFKAEVFFHWTSHQ